MDECSVKVSVSLVVVKQAVDKRPKLETAATPPFITPELIVNDG